uniref:protein EPIDERMAL PATTERNING FACTOR 2-like isoform X2 n=1 Tax=Erigeron canadensis TaxID=72917 RepID=UPI001CB96399|nr:protein EPIDERMAL PATTERNING FACTOR 2-like isoform X2 [Erigeron canadensis]
MKYVHSLIYSTWFVAIIIVLILNHGESLPLHQLEREKITHANHPIFKHSPIKEGEHVELFQSGSGIPDCSHACGPCFPCKRVMISYKCGTATESCPVIYRCFCRGKYYHVPSN